MLNDSNQGGIPEQDQVKAKLLTYNVFLRPPGVNNNGDDYKNERCELIIKELGKFDIICFQEVFGLLNSRKMKIKHKAFNQGLIYSAVSPSPSFFSGSIVDGGLLTMSRFPIIRHKFQAYPYGVLSDNLALKGVLYTKIRLKNSFLHLFNTHLQASYIGDEENIRATVMTRIDQLKCFRKFLDTIIENENPLPDDLFLLVGDFNVDALHDGYPGSVLRMFPEVQDLLEIHDLSQKYDEYEALMKILSNNNKHEVQDLLRANNQDQSPITLGDCYQNDQGHISPLETALTAKEDQSTKQCLDYIMQMKLFNQEGNIKIIKQSVQVEKFFVTDQKFTQLSDHYGVSCEILIN